MNEEPPAELGSALEHCPAAPAPLLAVVVALPRELDSGASITLAVPAVESPTHRDHRELALVRIESVLESNERRLNEVERVLEPDFCPRDFPGPCERGLRARSGHTGIMPAGTLAVTARRSSPSGYGSTPLDQLPAQHLLRYGPLAHPPVESASSSALPHPAASAAREAPASRAAAGTRPGWRRQRMAPSIMRRRVASRTGTAAAERPSAGAAWARERLHRSRARARALTSGLATANHSFR